MQYHPLLNPKPVVKIMSDSNATDSCEARDRKFEITCGITLAFLAAVLAVANLAAGRYEGNMMVAVNEQASAYSWYSSKSIKQTLIEGQHDLIESLLLAGSIQPEQEAGLRVLLGDLATNIERYQLEKTEILVGSDVVGEENWAQDIEGELGVVTGAQQWEEMANELDSAGDYFDLAILFLEVGLVIGAISLVLNQWKMKRMFFIGMNILGLIGLVLSILAVARGAQV
jgi:hypothetical protein